MTGRRWLPRLLCGRDSVTVLGRVPDMEYLDGFFPYSVAYDVGQAAMQQLSRTFN